jgi:hypothetical protein
MRGLAKPIFTEVYRLAKRAAEQWPLVAVVSTGRRNTLS